MEHVKTHGTDCVATGPRRVTTQIRYDMKFYRQENQEQGFAPAPTARTEQSTEPQRTTRLNQNTLITSNSTPSAPKYSSQPPATMASVDKNRPDPQSSQRTASWQRYDSSDSLYPSNAAGLNPPQPHYSPRNRPRLRSSIRAQSRRRTRGACAGTRGRRGLLLLLRILVLRDGNAWEVGDVIGWEIRTS